MESAKLNDSNYIVSAFVEHEAPPEQFNIRIFQSDDNIACEGKPDVEIQNFEDLIQFLESLPL